MQRLNSLTRALNQIGRYSQEILNRCLPIMQELTSEDNDIVEDVINELEDMKELDKSDVIEYLQTLTLSCIEDAQRAHQEIEPFSAAVVQGVEVVIEGEDDYPFLAQVWCGDMYEMDGIEALKMLVAELKHSLSLVDEDKMIDSAVERFTVK